MFVDLVIDITVSSTTFEQAAKQWNRLYNMNLPYDVMERRLELNRKRIAEAYYQYTYLEICQGYGIKDYQIIDSDLHTKDQLGNRGQNQLKHLLGLPL